ncbi:phage tail tube protein [Bathymodiolus septemdierum thioautotrophic gill symbiont]|uniref:Tail tube protein n=1 Tax=endosymbiont of Bathymodiolus septemdierum str. Myojin knoll TaxID=1303921 RepID=A0A0P0US10_9GAMM|nr:phage tail tube protein [Bathymodiolus septemdierum thioautotrophic gill symbiont]BAS67625.1 tail tube protein [endosymbiont of Bathymodiolus septemdierum str. Myojin knoll]
MAIITSRGTLDIPSMGRLPTQKGITYGFGNPKREPVMGDSGLLGHTEEYTDSAMIKCKLSDTSALDKEKLQAVVDETVTLQVNNGQAFTLNNAFMADVVEVDTSSGDIEVTFYGSELIAI